MVIAGGVYVETCVTPRGRVLMGSGGRAALALVGHESDIVLHTFQPHEDEADVLANFGPFGIRTCCHESSELVRFAYLHPLARPRISPVPLPRAADAHVAGDTVLRFGCLEGEFVVDAGRAIYDPQSASPAPFGRNASKADRLAIVLNAAEARAMAAVDGLDEAGRLVLERSVAEVVVVKDGAAGAHVFHGQGREHVPAYETPTVYKIGSGDVFTAMFAHLWATRGLPPAEAADGASRHVAHYVSTRLLPAPVSLPPMRAARDRKGVPVRVFLAETAGTTSMRWLFDEAREGLTALGAAVYSPLDDISPDMTAGEARRLAGLARCDVVFAMLACASDASLAVIEKGVALGKRVVVFAEDVDAIGRAEELGAMVVEDFAGSLYRTAWEGA